ncbi:tauA [Acrasis kona]|uniref:TauA n=1 Tax=Acrasis kona TaxID=1008807 RepID=A0AAW2YM30_9EUKA
MRALFIVAFVLLVVAAFAKTSLDDQVKTISDPDVVSKIVEYVNKKTNGEITIGKLRTTPERPKTASRYNAGGKADTLSDDVTPTGPNGISLW